MQLRQSAGRRAQPPGPTDAVGPLFFTCQSTAAGGNKTADTQWINSPYRSLRPPASCWGARGTWGLLLAGAFWGGLKPYKTSNRLSGVILS